MPKYFVRSNKPELNGPGEVAKKAETTTIHASLPSPVVGSSRKRRAGRVSSSVPIDSRRFSPPDIPLESPPPIRESLISRRPSCPRTCSSFFFHRCVLMLRDKAILVYGSAYVCTPHTCVGVMLQSKAMRQHDTHVMCWCHKKQSDMMQCSTRVYVSVVMLHNNAIPQYTPT